MPFKIVRNDITKMNTEAIVNTANEDPVVGPGCDRAVYEAAGREQLLAYRRENIGHVAEGEAFITPGFDLPSKYIIHAVSPLYYDGRKGEETLLRSCYRRSLALASEMGIRSVAFPLISTGSFGYPKEEGMRIAVDEIHAFLLHSDMQVYLVVFDEKATQMGRTLNPALEAYIDRHYVEEKHAEEYDEAAPDSPPRRGELRRTARSGQARRSEQARRPGQDEWTEHARRSEQARRPVSDDAQYFDAQAELSESYLTEGMAAPAAKKTASKVEAPLDEDAAIEEMEQKIAERMAHMADTFPQYLLYLIRSKGMENAEVYKRAIVDKKVFSKIKNNPAYHPQKLTALCLCVGAKLNLDEAKDLLARAGYALSPCDKTDIIFSYFIENGIYDMIELDIQLEEHGLPCIIS